MPAPTSSTRDEVRPVVPKLIELSEKVLYGDQLRAFYAGWPTAMTAARIAKGAFDQQK